MEAHILMSLRMEPSGEGVGSDATGALARSAYRQSLQQQRGVVLTAAYCREVAQFEYQTDANMDTAEPECVGREGRGKHCVRIYLVSMPSTARSLGS